MDAMPSPARLHTPEPEPPGPDEPAPGEREPQPTAPPIEDERGPQVPIREPGLPHEPARA
jgi:hypothetical protein